MIRLRRLGLFAPLLVACAASSPKNSPESGTETGSSGVAGTTSGGASEATSEQSATGETGTTTGETGTTPEETGTTPAETGTTTGEPETGTEETGTMTGRPAGPDFPDSSNTGVPPGIQLIECDPNITEPGTYDDCHFMGPITLFTDDVTIRRSKVEGYIRSDLSDLQNVIFEDIEVDAHDNITFNAVAVDGYSCRRCQVHDARVCFGGSGMTIEDSYCFDLHGEGDPATSGTHNEAIIAFGTKPIVIRHNNLVANWNATTTGGGMSAVVAIYSHGVFGPLGNVVLDNNRFENTSGAFYCMYSGQETYGPSGITVTDNIFVLEDSEYDRGCSSPSYPDWVADPSNVWSGNTNEDGTPVREPPST